MHIRSWCLACAGILAAQILALGSLPLEIAEPWNKLWQLLAYSGVTLLLWIATGGRLPVLVVAAVMLFGGIDELRQAWVPNRSADAFDFLAVLCAAVVTAGFLMWSTRAEKRVCAESSQR